MLPNDPAQTAKIVHQQPPATPPRGGLRRMQGMASLTPSSTFAFQASNSNYHCNNNNLTRDTEFRATSSLNHSASMANLPPGRTELLMTKPRSNLGLTRTKTSIGPLKYDFDEPLETPKKCKLPGGNRSTKISPIKELKDAPTPSLEPGMRRTSSGSMLLRQTPERMRFQEMTSPVKRMARSGSLSRLSNEKEEVPQAAEPIDMTTPTLKRKRTSSLTSLAPPSMPSLTPYNLTRLRPRTPSESRLEASPVKKRVRNDSEGGRKESPMKKRYVSTSTILLEGGHDANPMPCSDLQIMQTPQSLRRYKSTICTKLLSERIAQTYGKKQAENCQSTPKPAPPPPPPQPIKRSTSGDTYYSMTEGDEQTDEDGDVVVALPASGRSAGGTDVFVTPHCSFQGGESMVPLVKKQVSIDEKKMMEDEEDEGFGDSTKTIKRGQGAALARSVSLKLSPRKDKPKAIGVDTEKSCSTPSLPTAPLLRQSSSSSLRFKVSPSTFIRPLTVSPVVAAEPTTLAAPVPEIAAPETETKTSEPSTSTSTSSTTNTTSIDEKMMKKSALKKKESHPVAHEIAGPRRRNVKYDGLKVYYFDRRQGESTVPSEGEVSLAMQDNHHTHRYFPLSTGKRPILDLSLYDDEDLSDGEVIHPDSDGEHDYEEFSSAKFISAVNQKFRIKLLKKSGVKVEKNQDSIDALRKMRVECGCSCENGVCLPETCQCAIDGIQCQVDGGEYPTVPCACFAETCTNPNGRIFYDPDAVQDHRTRTIMNWRAAQKSGVVGSPVVKKFADSDDEDDGGKPKSWLLKKAIPIKLEASPTKYPVTPVYTRRSRTSLSDIRESNSEATSIVPSTTLSERMQHLENEVCVEEDEDVEKDDPTADLTEVYVAPEPSAENELLDAAMSPVQATLVV